jgi:hypothetical protein
MTAERLLGIIVQVCIIIVLLFVIYALAKGGFHLNVVNR